MKKSIRHKIIAFLLLIIFNTPILISSFHHHHDDEHLFCDKNDVTHLHKIQIDDCEMYHYQLSSILLFEAFKIPKAIIETNTRSVFNYPSFNKNNHNLLKTLRGPPYVLS